MPIIERRNSNRRVDRLRCRSHSSTQASLNSASQHQEAQEEREAQAILCKACNAVITHSNQAIRVNDQHEHAFFNPAGLAFELRCFRQAVGVSATGTPTVEFTWFPGYSWQIALCSACNTHLGWRFSNAHAFLGLIVDRLIFPAPSE